MDNIKDNNIKNIGVIGHCGVGKSNLGFAIEATIDRLALEKNNLIVIGSDNLIAYNGTELTNEEILSKLPELKKADILMQGDILMQPEALKITRGDLLPEDMLYNPKLHYELPERKSYNQPWAKCNRRGKFRK